MRIARGKGDTKCRAQARSAVDADVAGMLLDDAVGYGQAETGAAPDALGGKKRIVNLGDIVRIDPDPIVCDFNRQRVLIAVMRREHDAALPIGNRIASIENQVRKDLLKLY